MSAVGNSAFCLRLFLHSNPDQCKLVADFCGVRTDAVLKWTSGEYQPRGEQMWRLRVFLDSVGYTPQEFWQLPRITRNLCRILAFDVMSFEEARIRLGYGTLTGVYRVGLVGQAVLPDKLYRLENLVSNNIDEMRQRREQWLEATGLSRPTTPNSADARENEPVVPEQPSVEPETAEHEAPSVGHDSQRVEAEGLVRPVVLGISALAELVRWVESSPVDERLRFAISMSASTEDVSYLHEWLGRL